MAAAQHLKGEIRRLVLARSDVNHAARLIDAVAVSDSLETRWARWEAGIVAYARPFKRSRLRLPEEWCRFPNPDDQLIHDRLIGWRDKLFAHTDPTYERRVVIQPPFAAREERAFTVVQNQQTVKSAKCSS